MHKPYILAHDTGTGGDKAVLTDLRGRIVDSAYQAYGLNYPRPDWAEQDPGLSERDETAEICRDADGNPEPDPELRDIENAPLKQDVVASFRRVGAARARCVDQHSHPRPEGWRERDVIRDG
jgi:hypothetical protein